MEDDILRMAKGLFGRVSQPIYFLTVCLAISSFLDIWAMLSPSACNSLTSCSTDKSLGE